MPTVKLTLTDTPEKLKQVYQFLEINQVDYQKEEDKERQKRRAKQTRLLKRFGERPLLNGMGKEMARLRKEFREDFSL